MGIQYEIDRDIRKAETLPAVFYRDRETFDLLKEKVFLKSWHFIGSEELIKNARSMHPFVLLDHFLTEPMLLTRDEEDQIHCLSNVCTHRANLLVHGDANKVRKITCMYHGRRFKLNGAFEHMPEFKEAEEFPRPCEDLYKFPLKKWGPFLFAGLNPGFEIDPVLKTMEQRVGFLPLDQFKYDPSRSKDFLVQAHWALYCDNYLEGFHIPFVHESLNEALDYGQYTTLLYPHCNLQIGYADQGTEVFDLPEGHPDFGKNIGAYYYWVFPNMMFNFYPWGLSVNVVKPLGPSRTKVSFMSYVLHPDKLDQGAGAELEKVEREDEFVVENVQKGMHSAFYHRGRFSPKMEQGVHHFQRLLCTFLNKDK